MNLIDDALNDAMDALEAATWALVVAKAKDADHLPPAVVLAQERALDRFCDQLELCCEERLVAVLTKAKQQHEASHAEAS